MKQYGRCCYTYTQFPKTLEGKDQKEAKLKKDKTGKLGLIPVLGRSPGEGNGNSSSILAWRIPWTEESLVGYSPWGCRVGHN